MVVVVVVLVVMVVVVLLKKGMVVVAVVVVLVAGKFWVLSHDDDLCLLELEDVCAYLLRHQIEQKLPSGLISQPLLMPVSVKAHDDWHNTIKQREKLLRKKNGKRKKRKRKKIKKEKDNIRRNDRK